MDEQIVEYLQERQIEGIYSLIDVYSNLIYGIIYSIGSYQIEQEDIEECYNDVIFIIWNKIDQYDSKKGTFKNWMISIVKFKTIDYIRKGKKFPQEKIEEDYTSQDKSAEDIVMLKEDHLRLKTAIQKLEKIDEQIFTWRYLEELSVEEIASRLQMTPQAIYTRISRGKGKLKKWMGGNGDDTNQ